MVESGLKRLTELLVKLGDYQYPENINKSDCWIWALLAKKLLDNSQVCYALNRYRKGHAFLRYGNKYYDAECLFGVDNWQQLEYFKRNENQIWFFEIAESVDYFHCWTQDLPRAKQLIGHAEQCLN